MILPLLAAGLVVWMALSLWHFCDLLQFFQLHEYLNGRFLAWAWEQRGQVMRPIELAALLPLLLGWILPKFALATAIASLCVWAVTGLVSFLRWRQEQKKAIKPLVYTARVKRLVAAGAVVLLFEAFCLFWVIFGQSIFHVPAVFQSGAAEARFFGFLLGIWAVSQATVLNLILANGLAFPVEALMRAYYIESARRILRKVNPTVIGITGSYGKTSTKEILAHQLSSHYEVLKTPKTFNTIMGICMVIRKELRPGHRFFIVEMGAYKPGEIARLCRLVKPQIGILTAVGPQHLERFKTIENIARAKNELIEALPPDGTAIINGDDPICRELAQKAKVKTLLYGINADSQNLILRGQAGQTNENGASFELALEGKSPQGARTQLLGRHNMSNCVGATLAALQCGLTLTEAIHALASLAPLEHRLQVVRGSGGITTLDNAYNSNPSGARVALEVLGSFSHGRKILVTPGFAELGTIQAEEHARLGSLAAGVCDFIFLIGSPERRGEILKGIENSKFNLNRVFGYLRLSEAKEKLREILEPGDVVLFENDLPDIY